MNQSILKSTFKRQCPRCGNKTLFAKWNRLNPKCSECKLQFIKDNIDYAFVLYFTTAAVTGLFVALFLIVGFPANWLWRVIVIGIAALIMWFTLPFRKALAVAVEYKMRSMQ